MAFSRHITRNFNANKTHRIRYDDDDFLCQIFRYDKTYEKHYTPTNGTISNVVNGDIGLLKKIINHSGIILIEPVAFGIKDKMLVDYREETLVISLFSSGILLVLGGFFTLLFSQVFKFV